MGLLKSQFLLWRFKNLPRSPRGYGPLAAGMRIVPALSEKAGFGSHMLTIRPATVQDAALLAAMIRELAEFERELDAVTIRAEDLAQDGFGENPRFRSLIAEWGTEPAGYAVFFGYYSTWAGRGIFLEDLFVREAFRGRGIGQSLLAKVARVAIDEGCYGVQWEVLDWNEPAIELYKNLGVEFRDQWRPVLLTGPSLRQLAEKVS